MNILFLTFGRLDSINEHTIYCDLLREFINNGHDIYTLSPGKPDSQYKADHLRQAFVNLDTVRGGKNLIKKGLSTIRVENSFLKAVKDIYSNIKFDLVIYSTPPITLYKAVEYTKDRDDAKTFLLLKDIFPQNAVDIGLMKKNGAKGFVFRLFRRKEKRLYSISDYIGCMSQANVDYIITNNPEIDRNKVGVCPNSIEVVDKSIGEREKSEIRRKYLLPLDKKIFVYGGNLGKPQDIPFVINCLRKTNDLDDAFFVIVGDGSEYGLLDEYIKTENPRNVVLLNKLPKEDYDVLVAACDVGLIFLDHRFTIPNFPSRLLGYMQSKVPVLACTDKNTDIGKVITDGGFGWWVESDAPENFYEKVREIIREDPSAISLMKNTEYKYLNDHYRAEQSYEKIMNSLFLRNEK